MKKKILLIFSLWLLVISFLLFVASPVFAQESLTSPVGDVDITTVVARAIKLVLGLVGVLALVFFIYGGITWMTSSGNVEQVKKGKNALVWATLGLTVCFLAYSLVTFVITKTMGLGSSGSAPPANPDQACLDIGGTCLDDCGASCYGPASVCKPGLCSGPAARQCCAPARL